jgi:hypothetical protein
MLAHATGAGGNLVEVSGIRSLTPQRRRRRARVWLIAGAIFFALALGALHIARAVRNAGAPVSVPVNVPAAQ